MGIGYLIYLKLKLAQTQTCGTQMLTIRVMASKCPLMEFLISISQAKTSTPLFKILIMIDSMMTLKSIIPVIRCFRLRHRPMAIQMNTAV